MKELLRKPAAAFILACLLPALVLGLAAFSNTATLNYSHRTVVYSNGNVGEIMTAVENLKLTDSKVVTFDQHPTTSALGKYISETIAMAILFAFNWAVVNALYVRLKKTLQTEEH